MSTGLCKIKSVSYFCSSGLFLFMINIKKFSFSLIAENTILVWGDTRKTVIIDPGFFHPEEKQELMDFISAEGLEPAAILLTHAHFDHTYGVSDCLKSFDIPVYLHPDDKNLKEKMCKMANKFFLKEPESDWESTDIGDGDIISIADMDFKVIHTPGHSPGSVCYLLESSGDLFSGDTLFAGTIGRTDFDFGDYDKEIVSIMEKIIWLDSDIVVHPGHGSQTTIGIERTQNPFLQPFNEKDEDGNVDGISYNG